MKIHISHKRREETKEKETKNTWDNRKQQNGTIKSNTPITTLNINDLNTINKKDEVSISDIKAKFQENYRLKFVMNTDLKILCKILAQLIQKFIIIDHNHMGFIPVRQRWFSI